MSHGTPPWISFPRIKYHMVKVPHLWDFSLPPPPHSSQNKSHMLSRYYYIWNLCFLPGEGLPYDIPSWGTFAISLKEYHMANPRKKSHDRTSPGGGGQYHMVKFTLYGKSLSPHKFNDKGTISWEIVPAEIIPDVWYNFRGGGGRGDTSHVTPACS